MIETIEGVKREINVKSYRGKKRDGDSGNNHESINLYDNTSYAIMFLTVVRSNIRTTWQTITVMLLHFKKTCGQIIMIPNNNIKY